MVASVDSNCIAYVFSEPVKLFGLRDVFPATKSFAWLYSLAHRERFFFLQLLLSSLLFLLRLPGSFPTGTLLAEKSYSAVSGVSPRHRLASLRDGKDPVSGITRTGRVTSVSVATLSRVSALRCSALLKVFSLILRRVIPSGIPRTFFRRQDFSLGKLSRPWNAPETGKTVSLDCLCKMPLNPSRRESNRAVNTWGKNNSGASTRSETSALGLLHSLHHIIATISFSKLTRIWIFFIMLHIFLFR